MAYISDMRLQKNCSLILCKWYQQFQHARVPARRNCELVDIVLQTYYPTIAALFCPSFLRYFWGRTAAVAFIDVHHCWRMVGSACRAVVGASRWCGGCLMWFSVWEFGDRHFGWRWRFRIFGTGRTRLPGFWDRTNEASGFLREDRRSFWIFKTGQTRFPDL